ncbi:MAG TPA: ATP-binding protein [Dongiaceae bacterium]|nr:ATP-binding protein [Dongiaceae bacterium]
MSPDLSLPSFPAESVRLLDGLTALMRAETPESAADALMLLLEEEQAREAKLWFECPSQHLDTQWARDATPSPPSAFLDDLRRQAAQGTPVLTADPDHDLKWMGLPVPGRDACSGVLLVAYSKLSTPDPARLAMLAAMLGAKLLNFRNQHEATQDRERTADWFKTLDDQIRILEGERQKLAALVNKTDAAVFVADPEGRITWVNPVMSRRHVHLRHRIPAETSCRLLCGTETGCDNCPVRLVREGAGVLHQERWERREEGTRTLYVSAFPVRSPEGLVSSVLVMIQDITDLQTLRRSEARYQLLFERSPDAMVMAMPGTLEIVMANRQAREFLGLDPSRVPHPSLAELHPAMLRPDMKRRYDAIASGAPMENLEVGVVSKQGTRMMNATGSVFDLDGTDVLLLEFRDVTRLRELQAELARADHLIALGTMNAGIAHEFKNRLAPLRMFAQLLATTRYDPERILAHAPLILREVDRLSTLVRDVLDYARPQVPHPGREALAVILDDLVRECGRDYAPSIEAARIQIEFNAEDDLPVVWIDGGQVRRAFINLFKNALEALENHNGERMLRIDVTRDGSNVLLAITDSGPGIHPEALGRIFDPFYTTKGPRGTGLGMSITRSLIEANGGAIRVDSLLSRGTRVEVRFPGFQAGCEPAEERRVA